MSDETRAPENHERRVRNAFESFTDRLRGKLDDEARSSVEGLRDAASARDTQTAQKHLDEMRQRHGWLYRELAQHPEIATLLDELALSGL